MNETVKALSLTEKDTAMVKLAERYADVIDQADSPREQAYVMRWIAPCLLQVLESLGASPLARARLKEGKPAAAHSWLTDIRAVR